MDAVFFVYDHCYWPAWPEAACFVSTDQQEVKACCCLWTCGRVRSLCPGPDGWFCCCLPALLRLLCTALPLFCPQAPDVRAAFKDVARTYGGRPDAAVDSWLGGLLEGGRYLEDVWAG